MRLYRTDYPIVTREIDYRALREAIEETFAREYGPDVVRHVRVNHFNPDMIDVTIFVHTEQPGMYELALELSYELERMGLQVGFLVTERDY